MRRGFTLIELSIVLVIIGLIVGGILMGLDMIKAANIRATIGQVEKFKTASKTFTLKYNCLAGDCVDASSILGGSNGNGNGILGTTLFGDSEYFYFWQHLALAGMIEGTYTSTAPGSTYLPNINFPAAKIGGGFGAWNLTAAANAGGALGGGSGKVFPGIYGDGLILGKQYGDLTSKIPIFPSLSGYDAYTIDLKFDDGLPAYGTIMTWQNSSSYTAGCPTSDTASTAVYTKTTSITCSLFFLRAFN